MPLPLQVFVFAAGVFLVVTAILSALRATILPRSAQSRIVNSSVRVTRFAFRLRAKRLESYEARDRAMAMLGPTSLLAVLAVWLILVMWGFTLMFFAITGGSFKFAVELSGSSVFTLGTSTGPGVWTKLLTYTEAAVGLLVLTLLITYLPSIYAAFTRRESGVALLRVRLGAPPRAATMLIRYHQIEEPHYRLNQVWQDWERWFGDVDESHSTFPILVFFRSPQPDRSWITVAGALLDAAAFWLSAVGDHPLDPDAQLCIRAGYIAFRHISENLGISYDPNPDPDDPISITRDEWEKEFERMADAGMPMIADREAAWTAWKGWRVNYDRVLLELARVVEAPLAPWISDRSPVVYGK
ncbi:MAG TPA: hypothetical protein VFZ97_15270 [Acidimicrobiales bacterium]